MSMNEQLHSGGVTERHLPQDALDELDMICSSSDESYDGEFDSDAEFWEQHHSPTSKTMQSSKLIQEVTTSELPSPRSSKSLKRKDSGMDINRLSQPLIIPQQETEGDIWDLTKSEATALEGCGVTQAVFLDFLDALGECMKATPHFHVLNMPALSSHCQSRKTSTQPEALAAFVGIEASKRCATATEADVLLLKTNKELFQPHGLFAFLITQAPESRIETDDPAEKAAPAPRLPRMETSHGFGEARSGNDLYLMIVNLPSEEEMREAAGYLNMKYEV